MIVQVLVVIRVKMVVRQAIVLSLLKSSLNAGRVGSWFAGG